MLVCVICLDTDSRMNLLSELNLMEAYEKFTGYPLCDRGNLKQALCVQCAHQLRKFVKFRDKSWRARSLIMGLLEKHGLITQHLTTLQRGHDQLKNNLVSTSLGPDHCDLFILEVDRQTDLEEAGNSLAVKTECSDDGDTQTDEDDVINDDAVSKSLGHVIKDDEEHADDINEVFNEDVIKYESVLKCPVCYAEFDSENAYDGHLRMHMNDIETYAGMCTMVTALSARLATSTGNDEATPSSERALVSIDSSPSSERALVSNESTPSSERALVSNGGASHTRALYSDSTATSIRRCVVKLYDIFKCPQPEDTKVESSSRTLRDVSCCDRLNSHTGCEDGQHRAANVREVAATHGEPAAATAPSETESSASANTPRTRMFTCDVCKRALTTKTSLVRHLRIHTGEKPYSCEMCSYKCAQKSHLVYHMRTHTGEKPYSCEMCTYKCALKSILVYHMRIHTGEQPYSCKLCSYKSAKNCLLMVHMRSHTGEKPYSCKLCSYKCSGNSDLIRHMRVHTGEKPYSCNMCSYKCALKGNLVYHVRTHTGEKPYSCKLCSYKSVKKGHLLRHMRKHSGEVN